MAQKYYNSMETAKLLNITVDEVKRMIDRRELHGYRDGADWKFKVEDIEKIAQQRQAENAAEPEPEEPAPEDAGDVLLSEVALGQSDVGASGTVIGMNGVGLGTGESDIQLAGSAVVLSEVSTSQTPPAGTSNVAADSKANQFEDLDLTLDEDLALEDSSGTMPGKIIPGGSAIDLSGRDLEDDDLVLGGSDKGSDVSIGGDSGISLVDPADSGLSLEQPLDLGGVGDESLELGDDDMLLVGSSPALKTDDDFLLTPLEEAAEGDESESGSQVIALDTEGDAAAAMMGGGDSMAAMLDEDLSGPAPLDLSMDAPLEGSPVLGPQPGGFSEGVPLAQPSGSVSYEAPYTGWQIAGLASCAVLLALCGMMMYDNLRNMWSWDSAYTINSSLMDLFVGLFE